MKLEAAKYVFKYLSYYLVQNAITKLAALALKNEIDDIIREIGKHSLEICEGFNIPHHLVKAPVYTGYKEYYSVDHTGGEHYNKINRPKF